jgi:hypothetical protein
MMMWGCGKGNNVAVDPAATKVHSDPNWLATSHKKTVKSDIPKCAGCHGGNFAGGISGVSCLRCHPTGPGGGPPHPTDISYLPPSQHGLDAKLSLAYCAGCHSSGPNTQFTAITDAALNFENGCVSTTCHDQNLNLAHPYGWLPGRGSNLSHAATSVSPTSAQDFGASCILCHGANNLGGGAAVAPSCMSTSVNLTLAGVTVQCHALSMPVASLAATYATTRCQSCHATTPGTTDRHDSHLTALGLIAGSDFMTCATICHNGAGFAESKHATSIDPQVIINTKFDDGGAGFDVVPASNTCSNISCHGGKQTPDWTGSVTPTFVYDPATFAGPTDQVNCLLNCHTLADIDRIDTTPLVPYITVYNGNNTGWNGGSLTGNNLHVGHIANGVYCTECHGVNVAFQARHFKYLSLGKRDLVGGNSLVANFQSNGSAADTITGSGIVTYAVGGTCSAVGSCHSGDRPWFK